MTKMTRILSPEQCLFMRSPSDDLELILGYKPDGQWREAEIDHQLKAKNSEADAFGRPPK
jgi:hypothetical protein